MTFQEEWGQHTVLLSREKAAIIWTQGPDLRGSIDVGMIKRICHLLEQKRLGVDLW